MPPKTVKSNSELSEIIKNRRNELNLTIEEAALKAGIGTKTWSRYESGESIRRDKVNGLCKALKWKSIPKIDDTDIIENADYEEYRKSKTWSPFLEKHYGKNVALSFVIGSDILLDHINEDLAALSGMPKGSHIGEIPSSFVSEIMPKQFLMRYDYEFMYALRQTLIMFREKAPFGKEIAAHRVIDELVLYLIMEESEFLMEDMDLDSEADDEDEEEYSSDWRSWAFDVFDDMDIVSYLYSEEEKLDPYHTYHFDNWFEKQFYVPNDEKEEESVA